MSDHTPEPWFKRERKDQPGTFYLETTEVGWNLADRVVADGLTEEDADRILAMLNACKFIPTKQLQNDYTNVAFRVAVAGSTFEDVE